MRAEGPNEESSDAAFSSVGVDTSTPLDEIICVSYGEVDAVEPSDGCASLALPE